MSKYERYFIIMYLGFAKSFLFVIIRKVKKKKVKIIFNYFVII